MSDGTGTTSYHYASAANGPLGGNNLIEEDSPFSNSIVRRTYDVLGRVASRTIDAATDNFIWDKAGRLTNHNSPLGHEVIGYLGETGQVAGMTWSDHAFTTAYTYLPNASDRRLSTIQFTGQVPETLTYTTTATNRITQIADLYGGSTLTKQYGYDNAERLTSEVYSDGGFQNTKFDAANNVTSVLGSLRNELLTPNALNQIAARTVPSTVTGSGAASLDADYTAKRFSYDAENRLVLISYINTVGGPTGASTRFTYDGLGRRQSIIEQGALVGGVPPLPITVRYLWCGDDLCQARDGTDNVLATYYSEGVVQGAGGTGRQLYYTKDHLGSVQSVLDTNGALVSRNRYDAWGNPAAAPTGAPGVLPIAFAGQYYHAASGLYLAEHRAYDSSSGRWLSRDPLEEQGGVNLYLYVGGNPVARRDPTGLIDWPSIPDPAFNFSVGLADGLSLGIGPLLRRDYGIGDPNQCSAGYKIGSLAGVIGSLATGEGEVTVAFKTAHYADRLIAAGLDVAETEASVASEINAVQEGLAEGAPFWGQLSINGTLVQFRALLQDGIVRVGTIFPVR